MQTVLLPAAVLVAALRFTVADASPLPGVSAAVPSVLTLPDGRYRLYFCAGPEGMRSATSDPTGETLTLDEGTRIRGACDGSFIALRDGRYRFLTSEQLGTTFGKAQIISFITGDGLTFTRESGVRYSGSPADAGFTGVPQAIALPDGRHRLYYVGNPLDPAPSGNGVRTALSTDEGLTWTPEVTVNLLPRSYVDPEVVPIELGVRSKLETSVRRLDDSEVSSFDLTPRGFRMFVRVPGHHTGARPFENAGIYYADSSDGLSFTVVERVVRDPDQIPDAADPAIVFLAGGRMKMFLGSKSGEIRVAESAPGAARRRSVRSR